MRHKLNPVLSLSLSLSLFFFLSLFLFELGNRLNFSLGASLPLVQYRISSPPTFYSRRTPSLRTRDHPLSHLASLCLSVHCFLNYQPHFCQAELDFIFCWYCHLPETTSSRFVLTIVSLFLSLSRFSSSLLLSVLILPSCLWKITVGTRAPG